MCMPIRDRSLQHTDQLAPLWSIQPGNKIFEISAEILAKFRLSVEIDKISPPKF